METMSGIHVMLDGQPYEVQFTARGGGMVVICDTELPLCKLSAADKTANPDVFTNGRITHPLLLQARQQEIPCSPTKKKRRQKGSETRKCLDNCTKRRAECESLHHRLESDRKLKLRTVEKLRKEAAQDSQQIADLMLEIKALRELEDHLQKELHEKLQSKREDPRGKGNQ